MAVRTSKLAHMLMVRSLVLDLRKKGFRNIRADLEGLARPQRVDGAPEDETYVPDVTGDGRELNLFEVETADTIYDEHTAGQWTSFAEYARERHGKFTVVVPKGAADDARFRLDRLHVAAEVLEI